ncbi:MAG: hypothetical protein MJ178_04520 [Treponemataceae bacterium]|nr:hypothetical protein [Treponemataceae bacterium]
MRKLNLILAIIMMVLLALHAVAGAFMLFGVSTITLKPLSYALLAVFLLHALLGIIFTVSPMRSKLKGGKWYAKENAGYWIKRITGIVMLVMIWFHMTTWTTTVNGRVYLKNFTPIRFTGQMLFLIAIVLHIAVSIRPMLIKKGVLKFKERSVDLLLVLSVFLLFVTAAFIAWFIHWNF